MSELTKRVITAAVVVSILLVALIYGGVMGTFTLVSVASALRTGPAEESPTVS